MVHLDAAPIRSPVASIPCIRLPITEPQTKYITKTLTLMLLALRLLLTTSQRYYTTWLEDFDYTNYEEYEGGRQQLFVDRNSEATDY